MRRLILPGENSSGASGSGVHFIEDHVLQFLIVDGSEVDVGLQGFPEDTKRGSIKPKLLVISKTLNIESTLRQTSGLSN